MEEKVFCGNGKVITTKFGDMTKISFSEKDLQTLKNNLSNGWVNCVLKEKKNKVEGKPTHYLEIDNWKPDNAEKKEMTPVGDDSLPF
jgi:hypothetical protein